MSPNDIFDGRPDFTLPPGKPLDPDTIVPEDDAALSEPPSKTGEAGARKNEASHGEQSSETPDDEHSEGIPATWSEG